jgi:hypothetical protein
MRAILNRLLRSPHVSAKQLPRGRALRLETLEERVTPAVFFLAGVGSATSPPEPFARIYDATAPGNSSNVVGPGNFNAFPGFAGSVRVAAGAGTDDVICAQGGAPAVARRCASSTARAPCSATPPC